MAVEVLRPYLLTCDSAGCGAHFRVPEATSQAHAAQIAETDGWTYAGMGDQVSWCYCRRCSQRQEEDSTGPQRIMRSSR